MILCLYHTKTRCQTKNHDIIIVGCNSEHTQEILVVQEQLDALDDVVIIEDGVVAHFVIGHHQ